MSATNKTAVYELPIFLGTDVPSWLTDWNGAMGDIDTAIAAAKAAADAAASTAGTAATDIVTINGQITSLQNTVGTHTTQIGTISGSINTINSLIGNGTPTTTDQTIIGAINELHANQGDLDDLQTTDKSSLVAAINEAAQSGGGGGSETVRYYNGYIQYTTDGGVTWINLINVSTPVQLLPVMTNNVSSVGTVTTSNVDSSGTDAYKAIDGTDPSSYVDISANNGEVTFTFTDSTYVKNLKCKYLGRDASHLGGSFTMEYTVDGVTWNALPGISDVQNHVTKLDYTGAVNLSIKAFRVRKTNSTGAILISEIEAWN